MKVSIVTPALVLDEALTEARNSVARQVSRVEIEHFIVIDDRSVVLPPNDRTGNVQTYFSHNEHQKGPGGARNTALGRVSGDIVFFLDADDLWREDYLEEVLEVFAKKPEIHCVSVAGLSFGELISRPRVNIPVLADGVISRDCVAWNPVGCPSGFSYRRDGLTRALRFRDAIYFQDLIFYLELLNLGAVFWRHRSTFFWYRKSPGQLTSIVSHEKVRDSEAMVRQCLNEWRRNGLSSREALIASVQIKRLSAARLRRRDRRNTLFLCLLTPTWALGQLRRLCENIRIDRQTALQRPVASHPLFIVP